MKRLRSPKACAALVMIAWLASLVSLWGFDAAAAKAIAAQEPANCSVEDMRSKSVQLEMASRGEEAVAVLNGQPDKAACVRRGKAAEVAYADSFFLAAYSLLTLALFLFVRALRLPASAGGSSPGLVVLGALLALAMAAGDLVENLRLLDVIRLAGEAGPPLGRIGELLPGLKTAAFVKMGAVALAALLLGALWRSPSRWVWALRLFAFAAAALFAAAMALDLREEMIEILGFRIRDWQLAGHAMAAFAAFALAAVIHTLAVMADREPYLGGAKP